MNTPLGAAMLRATKLTRAQNVIEATRVLQRALSGKEEARREPPQGRKLLAGPTRVVQREREPQLAQQEETVVEAPSVEAASKASPTSRMKMPLAEVLKLLRQAPLSNLRNDSTTLFKLRKVPSVATPKGAAYFTRTYSCEAGWRDYKVYVPTHAPRNQRALVVMLHGCTQDPDDFAVGTGMNLLAEEHGFIVAYPKQAAVANQSACWNWFSAADQMRDMGEPSIIAGITRELITEFCIDPTRVYVAGLSAGGAMAAIMGATYPELYAGTGIHSGLAYGSATDVVSALAAMRGESPSNASLLKRARRREPSGPRRTIVFHGASDQTVHPSNSEAIFADARASLPLRGEETRHQGAIGGRSYTRRIVADVNGVPHAEHWSIEGLGHAWSGGSEEGSYADRDGPDASREMLRFFAEVQTPPT
jgi:poly(hydroxyalkanoate) depolymerase family esterase